MDGFFKAMFKLLVFLAFTFCLSTSLLAADWNDLWLTKDQQAKKAMDVGNYDVAVELFEDPLWRASAQYQAGNYSASAQSFLDANNDDGLYNYANSLVKMGQFPQAIKAYEMVIQKESNAEDAIFNRDLIQELLDQQQDNENKSQSEQSSDDGKEGEESDGQEEGESEKASGSQQSDGQSSDQDEDDSVTQDEMNQEDLEAIERELEKAAQEQTEKQEDEKTPEKTNGIEERADQEQQQAMEQWLRRIPDDPGGLLRRKFRYQYQRQGFDQDGNQLWPDDGVQPW